MVIDLTRKPVFINTDICANWVVVRTASNKEVDGRVRRTLEKDERRGAGESNAGPHLAVVDVGALRKREERTLMEVRLPIDQVIRRSEKQPIPNPFEVATVFLDAFTKKMGTWRVQILVERSSNKNGTLWLVTIKDEATGQYLVTATAKDLDASRGGPLKVAGARPADEQFPLERLSPSVLATGGPLSRWERLRQIEYDPHPGLDDEEL